MRASGPSGPLVCIPVFPMEIQKTGWAGAFTRISKKTTTEKLFENPKSCLTFDLLSVFQRSKILTSIHTFIRAI